MNSSTWLVASVSDVTIETTTVKTFGFTLPQVARHIAGQYYEIRLTAETGYQASRQYSAASAADGTTRLELTIARLDKGEVSMYLHDYVKAGDKLELRGPFGRFFAWEPSNKSPVFLIGGGSGVVPLRAMLQANAQARVPEAMRLLYSARTYDEIIYKHELMALDTATITLTRDHPPDWGGYCGRIDAALLTDSLAKFAITPVCYVCGATEFVETMADSLLMVGVPLKLIRAERFGK